LVQRSSFELDNANLLKAPGYDLVNVGLHYDIPGQPLSFVRKTHFYFEVQNIFNKTYVGSAANITDTLAANGQVGDASTLAAHTGSIFAGNPRTFYGGVRLLF
jgi:iron complex outermembrane recepter protein